MYCKKYFEKLFSCNTVSEIYKTYTRKQFEDILAQNNLPPMETKDITDLLDRHHAKYPQISKTPIGIVEFLLSKHNCKDEGIETR